MQPYQDWTPMILNKTVSKGPVVRQVRVEDETEAKRIKKVSTEMRTTIQKKRLALKMTQKQLADAINVRAHVVQEYESGKAVPDSKVINKLTRVLGPLK